MRAPFDGRRRAVIEGVTPEIDCGRFPIKRVAGDAVLVEADIFADGHDLLGAEVRYRRRGASDDWETAPMAPLVNDRWRGSFLVDELGEYQYTLRAWVDHFASWQRDLRKRVDAGQEQEVTLALRQGAKLVGEAATRAAGPDADRLRLWSERLEIGPAHDDVLELALGDELAAAMRAHPDLRFATEYDRVLTVSVDRDRARFSSWYELFPRSTSPDPARHGTFRDVIERLPYVAAMGFDVLYLPPIHPIGRQFRKGPDNSLAPGPEDPGVPWAIGGDDGGHLAIHPELGSLDDLRALIAAAQPHGLEIALDIAFQCSPDHPWVREHPEWFRKRPDGTIQYAENPPKKYQDIYPLDFETSDWRGLWTALTDVVRYWNRQGVRIFRVDNPHTKAFGFWEHCIREIKREDPGAIFLAEAFTRPKVMYRLAKVGFNQSYTYFAWRREAAELRQYLEELSQPPVSDIYRPNFWPNTPDILTDQLQTGSRPMYEARLILAATLSSNYGIYGPAFELMESTPREPGSEEYKGSEKYQQRTWDLDRPGSLAPLIARINAVRRAHPALQQTERIAFHRVDNERLLCFSKESADGRDRVLVVVNTQPEWPHSGWTDLDLQRLGLPDAGPYEVEDLLTGERYRWAGRWNFVRLDPNMAVAHILRLPPLPEPEPAALAQESLVTEAGDVAGATPALTATAAPAAPAVGGRQPEELGVEDQPEVFRS